MDLNEFLNEALEDFTREITDQFFLFIENDQNLFQKYLRVIGRDSNLDQTNLQIGKRVKNYFGLDDIKVDDEIIECKTPKSKLIKSYTEHNKK